MTEVLLLLFSFGASVAFNAAERLVDGLEMDGAAAAATSVVVRSMLLLLHLLMLLVLFNLEVEVRCEYCCCRCSSSA